MGVGTWFEVAVDDGLVVDVLDASEDVLHDRADLVLVQVAGVDHLLQRSALNQFHYEKQVRPSFYGLIEWKGEGAT